MADFSTFTKMILLSLNKSRKQLARWRGRGEGKFTYEEEVVDGGGVDMVHDGSDRVGRSCDHSSPSVGNS